eukprot:4341026-Amphidinium_carterae.1
MPSPAANITSRHEATLDRTAAPDGRLPGCVELGLKGPNLPARHPKECPCAKTRCMAKECHQTWNCTAMAKLPSSLGAFVQLSLNKRFLKASDVHERIPTFLVKFATAPLPFFCCCASTALARPGNRMEENSNPTS